MTIKASGIERGQRRLNGPQTTGREYVNLSVPEYRIARENSVEVPMLSEISLGRVCMS